MKKKKKEERTVWKVVKRNENQRIEKLVEGEINKVLIVSWV